MSKNLRWPLVGMFMLISILTWQQAGYAAPGNVFLTATPAQAPSSDDQRVSEEASHEIDESGAAHYTIPITVPPGRQGLQPKLSLSYSSRNPIRGGIAVGWSLSIPRIELDTSQGLLAGMPATPTDPRTSTTAFYRSSLSGTRLVRVPEAITDGAEAYRAELDTTYARYERVKEPDGRTRLWRMRTTDGRTWYFGDGLNANEFGSATVAGRSFLSRVIDKFGNSIEYTYSTVFAQGPVRYSFPTRYGGRADTYIQKIEWGRNAHAGLHHHARARFEYTEATVGVGGGLCPDSNVPIGANFTYRLGYPLYEGAMRLDRIRLEVSEGADKWREVRRYELSYDRTELSCPTERNHAPLRLLISVREIATDPILKTEATLPYVFEYGRRELELTESDSTGRSFGSGQNQGSPAKAGAWPTLVSMLVDLNGDGLLDGISAVDEPVTTHCNVSTTVYGVLKLPIVPWANGGPGQFGIRNNEAPLPGQERADRDFLNTREGCSASHQFSRVVGRDAQGSHGESLREGWVPQEQQAGWPGTYLSYRFMDVTGDGRPDLVTAIDSNRGVYRPENDSRLNLQTQPPPVDFDPRVPRRRPDPSIPPIQDPSEATCWGAGTTCPVGAEFDKDRYNRAEKQKDAWVLPERGPNNSYVFRVYENTGMALAVQPNIVYSPVPLETDRGTSNLGAGPQALGSMYHGFLDIDGDGLLDAISNGGDYLTGEGTYQNKFDVFRGDGTGNFRKPGIGWAAPGSGGSSKVKLQAAHSKEILGKHHTTSSETQVVMRDLNGDGLPDYISSDPAVSGTDQVRVFYNTGRGFMSRENYAGERLDTTAWATDDKYSAAFWNTYQSFDVNSTLTLQLLDSLGSPDGQPKKQVWSRAVTQVVDIDMDGLPDMVRIEHPDPRRTNPFTLAPNTGEPNPVTRLFINVGDKLVPMGETQMTRDIWQALARITIGATDGPWAVWTDLIDRDGDGLPEATVVRSTDQCTPEPTTGLIDYQCFSSVSTYATKNEDPKDQQGLRLLRTVKNGRGGSVQFHYQPWDRNTGGRVPYPLWVVSRVTVNAGPDAVGAPSPKQVTTYAYKQAVYNQDAHGDWGFRGFGSIERTGPNQDPTKSGAFTQTTYDYALHWAGLPVSVRVFNEPNGHPHRITKTVWSRHALFTANPFTENGPILTYHRREVEQRTCGNKQTLEDCEANGAARFDTYKYVAVASSPTAVPALFVETMHWVGEQKDVNQPGTRWREVTPLLISIPNDYRLITTEKTRWVMGEQPLLVGRTHHVFDKLTRRFELETHEYVDEATVAKTVRTYDETTGNMKTVTQPNEAVKATRRMSRFEYDARKLFVVKTTNELDHVVEASYYLGTGSQLTSRGPNAKSSVKEGWERKVDGFGRVREEWVYLDHPTAGYARVLMQRNFYHDAPVLNGHAGTIVWKRIEIDEDRWMQTLTEVDGLGHVVATTVSNASGEPVLAVSRYRYDAAGNLAQADLPSPTESPGAATVSYLLTFDTQGRPTAALRPDGTGQGWAYDGRSTMREDVIADKGGTVSRTRTLTDAWDRIIETDEQVTDSKWAITRYQYDGNDNVRRITNADNLVTEMEHDWLSQRVGVRRGGQTWTYGYDLNGNMTTIIAPMPAGADPTLYSTSITYDALDRPVTRASGSRDLTVEQLDRFEPASVSYAYDTGDNGKGRLVQITQPNSKTTTFTYDARGLVSSDERSFTILNNQFSGKRKTLRTYSALGQPHTITYPDGLTPAESTTVQYTYDDRGLPSRVNWVGHGELGRATYTAADGLATRGGQLSDTTIHQLTNTYDDLGRTVRQHLTTLASGQQAILLDQRSAYTGSDDVGSMNTTLGVTPQPALVGWNFTYDKQHQLIRAVGPLNYLATFAYSPAGRILSTDVNAAPEAPRVHRRKVSYDYGLTTGPGDPEAPDRLFDPTSNAAWMTMEYDPAGNVTKRTIQGQSNSWTHVYDGADLQREVLAPDGTNELYWYDHERQRTLIATKSASGAVERVRWVFGDTEIWFDGTGKILKTIAAVPFKGTFARIENRTKARFLYNNSRGDILLAFDQTQSTPAAEFAYGPYGESIKEGGTDRVNVLERFNGKQFDVTSGLSYYGYRYYDERSLTWTQADPLYRFVPDIAKESPRRFTTYAFSLNNPLRYMDPNGLNGEAPKRKDESIEDGTLEPDWKDVIWLEQTMDPFNDKKKKDKNIEQQGSLIIVCTDCFNEKNEGKKQPNKKTGSKPDTKPQAPSVRDPISDKLRKDQPQPLQPGMMDVLKRELKITLGSPEGAIDQIWEVGSALSEIPSILTGGFDYSAGDMSNPFPTKPSEYRGGGY